mgnify:CR=1 FL=1
MTDAAKPHQRRVRYAGTHPRKFEEKYKELDPAQHAQEVQKVMDRGQTPAGMHRSICVDEILDFLQIHWGRQAVPHAGFGQGSAAERFVDTLSRPDFWSVSLQKAFRD